jgi:hypothetical protein
MRCAQTKCVRVRDKPGKQSGRINEKGRNVLLDREGATFDPGEWSVILGDLFGGVWWSTYCAACSANYNSLLSEPALGGFASSL